jgi:hypothetical protein
MRERLLKIGGTLMLVAGWGLLVACIGTVLLVVRYMPEDERALTMCFASITIAAFAWMIVVSGKQMRRNEIFSNPKQTLRVAYTGFAVITIGVVGVVLSELRLGSAAGVGFALVVLPGVVGAVLGMRLGIKRNARI